MTHIVVVGSLNMDLVAVAPRLPLPGETLTGLEYLNVPGGKGANQAYAAAKLGGRVSMLGRVGSDEHGKVMKANLDAVGCNTDHVRITEGASGVALIFVAATGENSIVVIPGANDRYSVDGLLSDESAMAGTKYVLLQLETPMPTVAAAARAAKKCGACVILDPAPAPQTLSADLLQFVDILTPNETEAARLAGVEARDLTPPQAAAIARQLRERMRGSVILKLGAQGCLVSSGAETTLIPAPRVEAIDTTAAGDVFNAALAVALTEGADMMEACRFAVCASALSVTRIGAQRSAPAREEVDAFIDNIES
jgi:ribokinase